MPAAQPLQALLPLFQLGKGDLALGDLGVDIGPEFAAVRDDLRPLSLPRLGEQGGQPGRIRLFPPRGPAA